MNPATLTTARGASVKSPLAVVCLLLTLVGCKGDIGRVGEGEAATDSTQPRTNLIFAPAAAIAAAPPPSSTLTELSVAGQTLTLDELQSLVFLPSCSGCHTGGGDTLPSSMNFSSAADTYVSTIGFTSTEDPRLSIIEPGQSTNSYLIRKLEGTQSVGQQMPLQGDPLPGWMVDAIKRWIDDGAIY